MDFAGLIASAGRAARDILGGPVSYRPQYEQPIALRGVFDAEYRRADATQPGVAQIGPAVFLLLSDLVLPDGRQIDPVSDYPLITIGGIEYRVREPQLDHQGGVLLHLQRV